MKSRRRAPLAPASASWLFRETLRAAEPDDGGDGESGGGSGGGGSGGSPLHALPQLRSLHLASNSLRLDRESGAQGCLSLIAKARTSERVEGS